MKKRRKYRIAFFFHDSALVSLERIADALREKGERTFESLDDQEAWHHKIYDSDILWRHDADANVLTATVQGGDAVRTCGSLVEWMLRNAGDYLDDVDHDLKGVSVFA
jgi:hypothetical protein